MSESRNWSNGPSRPLNRRMASLHAEANRMPGQTPPMPSAVSTPLDEAEADARLSAAQTPDAAAPQAPVQDTLTPSVPEQPASQAESEPSPQDPPSPVVPETPPVQTPPVAERVAHAPVPSAPAPQEPVDTSVPDPALELSQDPPAMRAPETDDAAASPSFQRADETWSDDSGAGEAEVSQAASDDLGDGQGDFLSALGNDFAKPPSAPAPADKSFAADALAALDEVMAPIRMTVEPEAPEEAPAPVARAAQDEPETVWQADETHADDLSDEIPSISHAVPVEPVSAPMSMTAMTTDDQGGARNAAGDKATDEGPAHSAEAVLTSIAAAAQEWADADDIETDDNAPTDEAPAAETPAMTRPYADAVAALQAVSRLAEQSRAPGPVSAAPSAPVAAPNTASVPREDSVRPQEAASAPVAPVAMPSAPPMAMPSSIAPAAMSAGSAALAQPEDLPQPDVLAQTDYDDGEHEQSDPDHGHDQDDGSDSDDMPVGPFETARRQAPPIVMDERMFRTLNEVADLIGVPQHVLRFWETRFPQIEPVRRGGGRRYYRPEDVNLVRAIHALLHRHKVSIRVVQRILEQHGAEALSEASRVNALDALLPPMAAPEPNAPVTDMVVEGDDLSADQAADDQDDAYNDVPVAMVAVERPFSKGPDLTETQRAKLAEVLELLTEMKAEMAEHLYLSDRPSQRYKTEQSSLSDPQPDAEGEVLPAPPHAGHEDPHLTALPNVPRRVQD